MSPEEFANKWFSKIRQHARTSVVPPGRLRDEMVEDLKTFNKSASPPARKKVSKKSTSFSSDDD